METGGALVGYQAVLYLFSLLSKRFLGFFCHIPFSKIGLNSVPFLKSSRISHQKKNPRLA